jgi:hypothetical protein
MELETREPVRQGREAKKLQPKRGLQIERRIRKIGSHIDEISQAERDHSVENSKNHGKIS